MTYLSLSAMWAVKSPMEALNGSAFLPLLAVLELLGLKISWFPIRVGENVVSAKVGLPQLALDLVSEEEAMMNNGNNFRSTIPLVVSVAAITLVVRLVSLGSLFGSLPPTTNILESFVIPTCSAELFLSSTPSLESLMLRSIYSSFSSMTRPK